MNALVGAFLILSGLSTSCGIRILLFCPAFGISHLSFNARLANVLHSQGHAVTIVNQHFNSALKFEQEMAENAVIINVETEMVDNLAAAFLDMQERVFVQMSPYRMVRLLSQFQDQFYRSCEDLMHKMGNHQIPELLEENFDVALVHPYDNCPLAASRLLGITRFGWVTPGTYILAMTELGDRMTFKQKLENFFVGLLTLFQGGIPPWDILSKEEALARAAANKLGISFNLRELFQNISLFLVNGEAVLNFPRPFSHGLSPLGDLGAPTVHTHSIQPPTLPSPFREIVERSNGFVIFSFGTIADTKKMPPELRESFLQGFRDLTHLDILWKMDGEIKNVHSFPHVHLFPWIPQRQLLRHPKARLFVTHGGYNSLVEATDAGVPLLLIPLFGDQLGNAARAERRGIGLVLADKSNITPQSFGNLLHTLVSETRFRENARKLSLYMKDKIQASAVDLKFRIEALHRTQRPRSIVLAPHLNGWQYFFIDDALIAIFLTFFLQRIIAV